MSAFFGVIAIPLGWIMKACYLLVKNYGIALILFTIIIRLLLLPLNIKQQKSSARMAKLQPELKKLQKKYANNKEKYQEDWRGFYALIAAPDEYANMVSLFGEILTGEPLGANC